MIRNATAGDVAFIYDLYMHPAINPYLLYEPMSLDQFDPIFGDLVEKGVKFVYENDGIPMGMFKLIRMTYRSHHVAYLGGVAIHPAFGGQGHGQKMLAEMVDMALAQGVLRIELTTDTVNDKAIRLYRKLGFKEEGLLKKYTYLADQQVYLDEVLMAYTA